jgi:hypothetical protein
MNDNSEWDIPYVSKGLCDYLRERFSLPNLLRAIEDEDSTADRSLGALEGINLIIEELEGICTMQEERDGIRG